MQSAINEAENIISATYGEGARALTVTYRRMLHTWTVTVYMSTLRIEELCDTYDNAHAAWHEARRIAKAAHNGHDIARIVNEKPAHLALAEAKRLIDGISETLGEKRADLDAAHEQARQLRDQVQAQQANTGGWYAARRQAAARNAIPFRPTATRVHTQPPTPAQLDRIRQHHNGRVTCAPGQAWTLLRGIVDRGFADEASIEYKPNTRQYKAVRLNRLGWALLGQENGVAA